MAKKEKPSEDEKVVNYIIKEGIGELIKGHPEFEDSQEYLLRHVDQKAIWEKFYDLYNKKIKSGKEPKEARKTAYKGLAEYVMSGNLLDEKGKKIILKEGRLEKEAGFFGKLFHKPRLGERYLENTLEASNELNALMKSGDYEKNMPEITKSFTTLYNLKFLSPATDILREYGLITEGKYNSLKKNIYKRAKDESEKMIGGIEKYVVPQKIAASIIGLVGLVFILLNLNITGAVIGGDSQITMGIAGAFMIFFALLIYLRPLKKSFKK